MKKKIAIIAIGIILSTLHPVKAYAGAPWGEVLPKGFWWLRAYVVRTWIERKFDGDGNRYKFPKAYERSEAVDIAYGATDDLSFGAVIPYYTASLKTSTQQKAQGITDIKLGGQLRYYKRNGLASAFRLLFKLPTGEPDNPNNPSDISLGGNQSIEFTNFLDYTIPDTQWVISGQLRYNWRLEKKYNQSDTRKATAGETYKKDPGDEVWVAAGIQRNNLFFTGLAASLRWEARFHRPDDYNSHSPSWDESKEKNSTTEFYFIQPEMRYSLWKKHKIPLRIYSNYRFPLAGKNTYVTKRLEVGADFFF